MKKRELPEEAIDVNLEHSDKILTAKDKKKKFNTEKEDYLKVPDPKVLSYSSNSVI